MASQKTLPTQHDDADLDAEEFLHYYDQHATKEDLMGEIIAQSTLIAYLVDVLRWLYRTEGWLVVNDLNIYRERKRHEYPLVPDIAVFKGVVITNSANRTFRSWRLYISSDSAWKDDLRKKPEQYATLGVREYYAYDPNDPPYFPKRTGRLRGWWLTDGVMVERARDAQGRLWSEELESWLAGDGALLRLLDRAGQLRLTEGEAERAAKEVERATREAAWAKLRELGIDPTTL